MHQRAPADPYDKDELIVTSTTMTQPVADGYHGVAEEAVFDLFDDVFGGGGGDDGGASASAAAQTLSDTTTTTAAQAHPSDMRRLEQEHSTAGYRDGLTAGKNASLQAGFDEGYSLGAALGLAVGELLGLLEGLQAQAQAQGDSDSSDNDLLARARRDLAMPAVYAPAYFAPDGTWLYDVVGADEDEFTSTSTSTATIFDVARAHPLVAAWRDTVAKELARRGVQWWGARAGDAEALAAALGLSEEEPGAAAAREPKKVTATAATAVPTDATRPPASNTSALDW